MAKKAKKAVSKKDVKIEETPSFHLCEECKISELIDTPNEEVGEMVKDYLVLRSLLSDLGIYL